MIREYNEMNTKEQIWRLEKENRLQKIREEIDKIVDAEGMPIDPNIKETVVSLTALEFPTTASCEGHLDSKHGLGAPWVEISAPNEPEERFIGEKEIYQKIAEKYKVSLQEVKRAKHYQSYEEAVRETSKNEETPEYKRWREENKKLIDKVENLLIEFYKNRQVAPNIRLKIDKFGEGDYFRIHNGGEDYKSKSEKLTPEELEAKKERLKQYQKEMQEFAEFLKKKYFEK